MQKCFVFFLTKEGKSIHIVRSFVFSYVAEPQAFASHCLRMRHRCKTTHCTFHSPVRSYDRTPIRRVSIELQMQLSTEMRLSSLSRIHSLLRGTDCADGSKCFFPRRRGASPGLGTGLNPSNLGWQQVEHRRQRPEPVGSRSSASVDPRWARFPRKRALNEPVSGGDPHNSFRPIMQTGSAIQLGWLQLPSPSPRSPLSLSSRRLSQKPRRLSYT